MKYSSTFATVALIATSTVSATDSANINDVKDTQKWYDELCGQSKCIHDYCPEGLTEDQALIVETQGDSDNVPFSFHWMNQYRERLCLAIDNTHEVNEEELEETLYNGCDFNDAHCLYNALMGHVANFNLALASDPYTLVLVDTSVEDDQIVAEERRNLQATMVRPTPVIFGSKSAIQRSQKVYGKRMSSQVKASLKGDGVSYGQTRKQVFDMSAGRVTPLNRVVGGKMEISTGWNRPGVDMKYSNSMNKYTTKIAALAMESYMNSVPAKALDTIRETMVGTFNNEQQREAKFVQGKPEDMAPMSVLFTEDITNNAEEVEKASGNPDNFDNLDVLYLHEVLCFNQDVGNNIYALGKDYSTCIRSIVEYKELADGSVKVNKFYVPKGFVAGSKFDASKLYTRANYKEQIFVESNDVWQVRTSAKVNGIGYITEEAIHFGENNAFEGHTYKIANNADTETKEFVWGADKGDVLDLTFMKPVNEIENLLSIPEDLLYVDEDPIRTMRDNVFNPPSYSFKEPEDKAPAAPVDTGIDMADVMETSVEVVSEKEAAAVFLNKKVEGSGDFEKTPSNSKVTALSAIAMIACAPFAFGKSLMKKLPAGFSIDLGLIFAFVGWYLGNYQYNIANKSALAAAGGAAGFPMTIAVLQLAVGALYATFMWVAPDGRPKPTVNASDLKKMVPVAFCAMGAHAASVLCLSAGAVSFGQIVKAAEPVFAALVGLIIYKKNISNAKWLALIPVIGGVGLASLADLSFGWMALISGCVANIFAAFKGQENQKLMQSDGISDRIGSVGNQYALTTIMATIFAIPVMLMTEGAKLGQFMPMMAAQPGLLFAIVASGLWFYGYNELSTLTIKKTNAVTMSVANTAKRVIVIVGVAIALGESLAPMKMLGCAIGIGGVFLYSIIDTLVAKFQANKNDNNDQKNTPAMV